jgi:NADPH-dependent 2,4-dienoyl-CoA reductase/sulfur reductase-like enzyme
MEDSQKIGNTCQGKNVLIVGSSFIGMEVASCIVEKANRVTVIGMEKVPFERVLGREIGVLMQRFHESKNVSFIMEAIVKEFVIKNGEATSVILRNDQQLPCDVIILGAGVSPATAYIKKSELVKKERDGSIVVDESMWTGADGLWAVGDLARYPFRLLNDELVRIEHWGMAQTQAMIAAKNMAARSHQHSIRSKIPYFWTVQFSKNIRYCGHALRYDEVILDKFNPDVTNKEFGFIGYYILQGKLVAACSMNRDPLVAQIAEILNEGVNITGDELNESIKRHGMADELIKQKLEIRN